MPLTVKRTCPTCHGHGMVDVSTASATYRRSDPNTARAAGNRQESNISRFSVRSQKGLAFQEIAKSPMTAHEAAVSALGEDAPLTRIDSCRRRVSELSVLGYICDSGQRRMNPGSPDLSIVWKITDAGSRALRVLIETGKSP